MFTKGSMLCLIIILHIHQCLNLCIERERQALIKIAKDIYDPHNQLSSWKKGGDCCNWQGIACHNTTGHVIHLDLSSISGYIIQPEKRNNKSKLNHSLVDLKHLAYLNLSYNFFGASIPMFIGSLTRLEYLDLYNSGFEGIIPPQLGNLTRLEYLDLSYCGFKGTIPPQLGNLSRLQVLSINNYGNDSPFELRVDDLHWLSGLTSLTYLNMDIVNLSTAVDWFDDITKLPFITAISFRNCALSSIPMTMPPLNNFTFVQVLYLGYSDLNSTIPGWLFNNISSLEKLGLHDCGLYGELPHSIGNSFNLNYLFLGDNNIEGQIPDSIGNLKKLEVFYVERNLLSGEIPHSLFNLTNLTDLHLSNNNFWGEVPKSINLNHLVYVDLSNNRLNGSIFFSNQSSLLMLDLSNNSFIGMLPFSRSIKSGLVLVNLSNNRFSGTIPNLFMFHPNLQSLQLGKNKLNGLIPSSLKYCKRLMFLDLSENELGGKIQPWIGGTLLSLKVLNLRSNNFIGQIPRELSYLTSLRILDLSHNYISGKFSLYFDNFTVMTKEKRIDTDIFPTSLFYSVGQSESIWLNKQGIIRLYTTTLQYTILIDVSSNEISEEIPIGITKLVGLKFLNLSRNNFIGNIPKNIGAIKDLEVLDLSSNKLSGELPFTMTEMAFLSNLNVSYNNLSGMIPVGSQFQTFDDPSIYSGNSNLCGWPLSNCSTSNNNNTNFDGKENKEHEYEHWYEKTWINAGTVVGFLISYWGIFITLLLNNSMRHLHFYYVDKLYGLISLQFHIRITKIKTKIMEIGMH